MENFDVEGEDNHINIGENVDLRGSIVGRNNHIEIDGTALPSVIKLIVRGNENKVFIGPDSRCRGLDIRIGNHVPASKTHVEIGQGITSENECKFLLYNNGNVLRIGDDCMFSNSITLRCGESPHLIFNNTTGEYLDISSGVIIGNHVWVGERSYITKHASVADGCIVAACSVVTKSFEERCSVIAGNPAKVVRSDVKWVRNRSKLVAGSIEAANLEAIAKKYN